MAYIMTTCRTIWHHGGMNKNTVIRDQERRRSNVAVPIPLPKHKRPRSRVRQELRQEYTR